MDKNVQFFCFYFCHGIHSVIYDIEIFFCDDKDNTLVISEEQHHKIKYDFSIYGLLLLCHITFFLLLNSEIKKYFLRPCNCVWKDKGSDWNCEGKNNNKIRNIFFSKQTLLFFSDIFKYCKNWTKLEKYNPLYQLIFWQSYWRDYFFLWFVPRFVLPKKGTHRFLITFMNRHCTLDDVLKSLSRLNNKVIILTLNQEKALNVRRVE